MPSAGIGTVLLDVLPNERRDLGERVQQVIVAHKDDAVAGELHASRLCHEALDLDQRPRKPRVPCDSDTAFLEAVERDESALRERRALFPRLLPTVLVGDGNQVDVAERVSFASPRENASGRKHRAISQ